ncbi:response regulator [Paenibacillus dendritiformis]|uniref:ATP-binding response regulator n=1 Tax=Paenibacillus dendritiformis TaxID=130049 RepID=UPI00143D29AC|nr:response regulator [Paenibacillus dendritiformis]NKI19879.1 response regulator [Paenibacillus dendritiformis]
MKILLVEDDKTIASGLEYSLQQEHFSTLLCHDAASAKKVIADELDQVALCSFDLSLPDGSGYELCKLVKERRDIPVIFLTVIDDEVNVVMGLDMGADDYITKPFRVRELLSRIKSVLRRYHKPSQTRSIIEIDQVRINTLEGKVYKHGAEIPLTALEYRLLLRFYKGKNASEGSIGIGLSMAHSMITSQNGVIDVASGKDKGTQFRIKFYKQVI